jgi:hypothetical protein
LPALSTDNAIGRVVKKKVQAHEYNLPMRYKEKKKSGSDK